MRNGGLYSAPVSDAGLSFVCVTRVFEGLLQAAFAELPTTVNSSGQLLIISQDINR